MSFLGFGRITQAALKRLVSFGVKIAIYVTSKPSKPIWEDCYDLIRHSMHGLTITIEVSHSIDQSSSKSDVAIVECALTPSTKRLVNAEFVNTMEKISVIENIARSPAVDIVALLEALDQGKIFDTGLDIFEDEPTILN